MDRAVEAEVKDLAAHAKAEAGVIFDRNIYGCDNTRFWYKRCEFVFELSPYSRVV